MSNDPFNTSCVGPIDPFVQNALNYGYDIHWPDLAMEPHEVAIAFYEGQRRQAFHCPIYLHVDIKRAASLWLHLHQNSPDVVRHKMHEVRCRHAMQALKMMEELAKSPDAEQYTTLLLMGAFGIACHPLLEGPAPPSRFPESPLAEIQHLDASGSMEILRGFTETVVKWVRRKGGLAQLIAEGHQQMVRILLL